MNEDNIFEADDLFVEDTTPNEETGETVETPQQEEPVETEAAPQAKETAEPIAETIDYRFNHEVKSLDRKAVDSIASALGMTAEDVVANLQKGTDYERVRQMNEQNQGVINRISEWGGVAPNEIEKLLDRMTAQTAMQSAMRSVREQYPDLPDNVLQDMARMRVTAQMATERERKAAEQKQKEEQRDRPWVDFFVNHPEISPDKVPHEVLDGVNAGLSPNEAWLSYQLKQKEIELQQTKKTQTNKQKAIGSLGGEVSDEKKDPFLEGFDSV